MARSGSVDVPISVKLKVRIERVLHLLIFVLVWSFPIAVLLRTIDWLFEAGWNLY